MLSQYGEKWANVIHYGDKLISCKTVLFENNTLAKKSQQSLSSVIKLKSFDYSQNESVEGGR